MGQPFDVRVEDLETRRGAACCAPADGAADPTSNESNSILTPEEGAASSAPTAEATNSKTLEATNGKAFYIETFGCQMNEHDSEKVSGVLMSRGYRMVNDPAAADVVFYNTCSIREKAAQKVFSRLGLFNPDNAPKEGPENAPKEGPEGALSDRAVNGPTSGMRAGG